MHEEPRIMFTSRLSFAFAAAALLSACAGGGKPAPTPTPRPHFTKGQTANLTPNSNSLGGWIEQDYKTQATVPGKPVNAVYVGTGRPNSAALYAPVAVVPGHSYVFSAWIDASHVTVGSPVILVASSDRLTLYGEQIHVSGKPQRFSDIVTIPDGVTRAVLAFTNAGSTTPPGKKVIFSQPMFRADGVSRPYKASSEEPITVYLASMGASGQTGSATIRETPGGVNTVVHMNGESKNGPERLWIAKDVCGGARSMPWKELAGLKNGASNTTLPGVTLTELKLGTYSLAVTASASKISVACGNLKS